MFLRSLFNGSKVGVVIGVVVGALIAGGVAYAFSPTVELPGSITVIASDAIKVYSDPECTNEIHILEWGEVAQNVDAKHTVYVKNVGAETIKVCCKMDVEEGFWGAYGPTIVGADYPSGGKTLLPAESHAFTFSILTTYGTEWLGTPVGTYDVLITFTVEE